MMLLFFVTSALIFISCLVLLTERKHYGWLYCVLVFSIGASAFRSSIMIIEEMISAGVAMPISHPGLVFRISVALFMAYTAYHSIKWRPKDRVPATQPQKQKQCV